MYNNYYTADKVTDKDGDEIHNGFDVRAFANVHRFLYVTNKKILGAYYAVNVIAPIVTTNLEIDAAGIDENATGVADITVEPLMLVWHRQKFDMTLGAAVILPTGDYDKDEPLNLGSDHYTFMLSYGGTFYFDSARTIALGLLARYEKHFENRDLDITYGDDINFEWGISKDINKGLTVGLAGYAHWQITDDDGSDVNYDESIHDHIYAVGPEVDFFIPATKSIVKAKVYKEFEAKDTSEGTSAWLTFIQPF